MVFKDYDTETFYDELFEAPGKPRRGAKFLMEQFGTLSVEELETRQKAAELSMLNSGITFTVYGDEAGTEKIFPFDIVPRIIMAREWKKIEAGLRQRIYALNQFIADIYGKQQILKDQVVPKDLILRGKCYRKACQGLEPPKGIWCHISGSDLVRDEKGQIYVLEDNMRCPSGVSYLLENRMIMKRIFPEIFNTMKVRRVDSYPDRLLKTLQHLAPEGIQDPTVVVLTPGIYNSAYFEHSYLARQMGVELVEGSDLVIKDDFVQMRTTQGLQKVDVIYRRIDDDFIDPKVFRKDSLLGVPGITEVYANGRVALVNALGTGIADDKVVYSYVPQIIKYYLDEDPILPNVPTYVCSDETARDHVLENLGAMVVKSANEAGGYGMLIGPASTKKEQKQFAEQIKKNPRNYIGQPVLSLSRSPTFVDGTLVGRHVDLRPYVLYGEDISVIPGGLTRVALKKGSLVVNSSQGGGSKDTWVLSH